MMAAAGAQWPTLGALVGDDVPAGLEALQVTGLTLDSREVEPGFAFVALRGAEYDGLEFAAAAIAAGAAVVLHEPRPDPVPSVLRASVPLLAVPDLRARLGGIADRFYAAPSARLRVAGITGTNGKTTVARLVAVAATQCGLVCGSSGTLGVGLPGALRASALTTPDVIAVHRRLAALLADGATHAALEVSSHALVQDRVAGVRFDTAVFTNLTRDHLDYHGTMDAYLAAKRRLLEWPQLRHIVINTDDDRGRELAAQMPTERLLAVGARATNTDAAASVTIAGVKALRHGIEVGLRDGDVEVQIRSPLLGDFNATNLALAFAVLRAWGVGPHAAARALAGVSAPPGRMEAFGGRNAPLVVVDYAHTPDALAHALMAARAHCAGRLWVVFGCGGERDPGKRPLMGEIAARCADRVIVTDDNPRREDPQAIIDAIVAGAGAEVLTRRGRRKAIAYAVAAAQADDVIVVAGKGHEDYQILGERRLAYSDRTEVERLVGERQ